MKKLLAAAVMVVLASPAFAAIQNVKVSGDITSTFIDRNTFNLGLTKLENSNNGGTACDPTVPGNDCFSPAGLKKQNVFITQTRVRIDADLSDNVSTTVGLINERAWGGEGHISAITTQAENTDVQLYLANLTLREFLYSPLTVTVGRQVFNYGNGLILGDGGVNNQATGDLAGIAQDLTMRTSYDGVKAVLDYKPLTIDLLYFKNTQNVVNGNAGSKETSSDVFGVNANYQMNDAMNTVGEVYMFSRFNGHNNGSDFDLESVACTMGTGACLTQDKGDSLWVPGLRASTNPIKGLNVQGEVAWQLGRHTVFNGAAQESERRSAMAAQFMTSYAIPVMEKYKPTMNASYTYVSGDKNAFTNNGKDGVGSAKTFSAWDPFNENQGSGTIYNTLFPLSNLHIVSVGGSINPIEDVTASLTWNGLWSAENFDNTGNNPLYLFQPDGGAVPIVEQVKVNRNRALGNEWDVNFVYNYTEDVTFGVNFGWFVPGDAFTSNNNNIAQQALADVAVKF